MMNRGYPLPVLMAAGGLLGLLQFLIVYDLSIANPSNVAWALKGDWGVHYTGWEAFRNEPWAFPLGKVASLGYPLGTTVGYTDSIPLLALLLKPFESWLPVPFQYLGLWILLSFVLLGAGFAWLLKELGLPVWAIVLGTMLVVLNPVIVNRFPHPALNAHFLVIFALAWYLRVASRRMSLSKAEFVWVLLITTSAAVHPLLACMVFTVYAAHALRVSAEAVPKHAGDSVLVYLFKRSLSGSFLLRFLGMAGLLVSIWVLLGYFSLGGVDDLANAGLGHYNSNLLGPLLNFGWSWLLPHWGGVAEKAQGDAMSYPGLGGLLVLLLGLSLWLRQGVGPALASVSESRWWPLWLGVFLLSLFATYGNVSIGPWLLLEYHLPWVIEQKLSIFRANGRFIWLLFYLLMAVALFAVVRGLKAKHAAVFLLAMLALQMLDVWPVEQNQTERLLQFDTDTDKVAPFPTAAWAEMAQGRRHLVQLPVYQCALEGEQLDLFSFMYFAIRHDMTINSVYSARRDAVKTQAQCDQLDRSMRAGELRKDSLYVLSVQYHERLQDTDFQGRCRLIAGVYACVNTHMKISSKKHNH